MPLQIIRQPTTYDVCIVGSGAGGGMAAKALCEAGANVALIEAGQMWDAAKDSKMMAWAYDSPRRGGPTPARPFGEFDGCIGGWDLDGEPYTMAPGTTFDWFRARMLGGRPNHWGRISLRFGPDDFRRHSLDGLGDDWPISYDDLKPYYDTLDRLVGIFGSAEGLPNEHFSTAAPAALLRAADQAGLRSAPRPVYPVAHVDCQAHDVKNLFIADGGPFVSNADKNVTWAILALSMRTSEYIAQARNQRRL